MKTSELMIKAQALDAKQIETLSKLNIALSTATNCGLLDILAGHVHPDVINKFCDAVETEINSNAQTT